MQFVRSRNLEIVPGDPAADPRTESEQVLDKPSLEDFRDKAQLEKLLNELDKAIAAKVFELGLEFAFGDDLGVRQRILDDGPFKIRTTADQVRPMHANYSFRVTFLREE